MTRAEWRVPTFAFALLALPGNIDNILPQMRLDPNILAENTAPIATFADGLLVWALFLTWREGRFLTSPRARLVLLATAVVLAAASVAAIAAGLAGAADWGAVGRGIVTYARIPATALLVLSLTRSAEDAWRLTVAVTLGLASLVANGIYQSASTGDTRFTAATFGRNGLALALVLVGLCAMGLAVAELARRHPTLLRSWLGRAALLAAMIAVFCTVATGTRMALLAILPATAIALVLNRTWRSRTGVLAVIGVLVMTVAVSLASAVLTAEGGRAISILTDPEDTVDTITDPGGQPSYSSARTRTRWWQISVDLAIREPLTGIGPFQWNFARYEIEEEPEELIADPHNSYLQAAAEYGFVVGGLHVAMVVGAVLVVLVSALRTDTPARRAWPATMIVAAAAIGPFTELTNSHFFNVRLGALEWVLISTALAITFVYPHERSSASAAVQPPPA